MTPGFPLIILWNDKYLISKNYDGNHPIIIKYVVINLDSINTDYYKEPRAFAHFLKEMIILIICKRYTCQNRT